MSTESSSSPLSAPGHQTPDDRRAIRTAVVGYGLSGSVFHAPLIAADSRYSLDVIATSDAGRQAAAVDRYPGVKTVPDADAVLAMAGDLDLVVLGTPPATHYPLAKAALEAGLDVVVDKPFTVTSAEGVELTRTGGRFVAKETAEGFEKLADALSNVLGDGMNVTVTELEGNPNAVRFSSGGVASRSVTTVPCWGRISNAVPFATKSASGAATRSGRSSTTLT